MEPLPVMSRLEDHSNQPGYERLYGPFGMASDPNGELAAAALHQPMATN